MFVLSWSEQQMTTNKIYFWDYFRTLELKHKIFSSWDHRIVICDERKSNLMFRFYLELTNVAYNSVFICTTLKTNCISQAPNSPALVEIQLLPFHHPPSSLPSNGCKALNDEKQKHGDKRVRAVCRPCSLYQTVADIPHRH